eukprot:Selendium_serpulae@DN11071_c0_g1_i1.p1
MANWIKRAAELLMIAKSLNATFVEPCIKNGSLRSCLSAKERFSPIPTRQFRDTINVRLGDIFDLEKLKLFHPLIISHDEFYHATKDTTVFYKSCMQKGKAAKYCKSPSAIDALKTAVQASKNGFSAVAQFNYYYFTSWDDTTDIAFDLDEVREFRDKFVYIRQQHHD